MFILFCFYNRFQIQCSIIPNITTKATIICNTAPTSPMSLAIDVGAFRLWWLEILYHIEIVDGLLSIGKPCVILISKYIF